MIYRAMVDGFKITEIDLPEKSSQEARDSARRDIAKDYGVPQHYIRLVPPHYSLRKQGGVLK